MHNPRLIIPIIAVFLLVATSPFWYGKVVGSGAGAPPKLELPKEEKQCVESAAYMREHHVELLVAWRDSVVREGNRIYRAQDGEEHQISLTGTCLSCHTEKANFCDRCHGYVKVSPKCWDCHLDSAIRNPSRRSDRTGD